MSLYKWVKNKLLKQENLYVWFLFITLLPCIVLALTEPLSPWVKAASVLIPFAVYGLLFNLFRKPGFFLMFCFILLLINGYQLVLLYLFSESVVSPDMFLNIVTTNAGESGELMRTIWPAVLMACLLYFSAMGLAVYSICNKKKLSWNFVRKSSLASIIAALFGIGCLLINHSKGFSFVLDHDIYPVNAFYNLNFAANKYIKTIRYPETSKDFTFKALKGERSSKREVYLLVIGETSRAANWGLWGYDRPTNPNLSKRSDLLVFKDVLTQGNTTHKIVPMILSAASAENFECIYSQKSMITAFKEAGFKTAFISNQIPDRAFIDDFAAEADTLIRVGEVLKQEKHPYDNEAVPFVRSLIESSDDPLFIVFHSYGSHFEYSQRYAPENAVFTPHKAGALRYKERPMFLNAYDNTICNIDNVLSQLIGLLDRPDLCSGFLYSSDHGEDLMDDERKMFLHCSPVPTYYQLHIPFLIWFSEEYKNNFPDQFEYASKHTGMPVSTNSIFHTMLDMARINTEYKDKTLSLVGQEFYPQIRHFIDEHDEPEKFRKLGLKEQDWEQIDKLHIRL